MAGKTRGSESPQRKVQKESDFVMKMTKCERAGVAVCCAVRFPSVRSVSVNGVAGVERHPTGSDTHHPTLFTSVVMSASTYTAFPKTDFP